MKSPVLALISLFLIVGTIAGCGCHLSDITVPPQQLPGVWAGFGANDDPHSYYRLELREDGTGLYGTKHGTCDAGVYRITKWTTGEDHWEKNAEKPYPFHADLIYEETGAKAELSGEVSFHQLELRYRQPDWPTGCYQSFVVISEEFLDSNIADLKKAMKGFAASRPSTTNPSGDNRQQP